MINGESYKAIVAEAGKKRGGAWDNIIERVFIVRLLLDKNDKKPGGRRHRVQRARAGDLYI